MALRTALLKINGLGQTTNLGSVVTMPLSRRWRDGRGSACSALRVVGVRPAFLDDFQVILRRRFVPEFVIGRGCPNRCSGGARREDPKAQREMWNAETVRHSLDFACPPFCADP